MLQNEITKEIEVSQSFNIELIKGTDLVKLTQRNIVNAGERFPEFADFRFPILGECELCSRYFF